MKPVARSSAMQNSRRNSELTCVLTRSTFAARRDVTQEVANAMSKLANALARVLAESLGYTAAGGEQFPAGCDERTCFLRLNRYPPCPFSPDAFGLVPHTDSDFLTVLCQDQVGGLQLMKGSRWVAVKPIPGALIVNIGDLFQVPYRHTSSIIDPYPFALPLPLPS
jgi:gibberellin 2-oxidase